MGAPSNARCSTIAEIVAQQDDTLVMLCRGTITNIYPPSEGDNEHGHWSIQNIVIKDATGTIKVKLKNRETLTKADKGKLLEIAAFHSDKHGWVGAKAQDDTYNGKTSRIIYLTAAAELSFPAESGTGKQQQRQAEPQHEQPQSRDRDREPEPPPREPTGAVHPLTGARSWLMQWANAYVMAFDAAAYVAQQIKERHGLDLSVSDIKDIATSASIGFAKEMDIAGLPAKPIPSTKKTKPETLEDLRQLPDKEF